MNNGGAGAGLQGPIGPIGSSPLSERGRRGGQEERKTERKRESEFKSVSLA